MVDMSDLILSTTARRVTTLTLNRPDRRNALTPDLITELTIALSRAEADPEVGAVVLTGAGDKAFCAGADLTPPAGEGLLAVHAERRYFADLLLALTRYGKPIIGAANGHALAGGFGLLQACDFVIARRDARYGTPEIRRGLFPMMILAVLLRTLGRRRALELALTGREIDGETLERWGGANRVVEADAVIPEAQALGEQLAALPGGVMALGRRALFAAEDLPFASQLDHLHAQLTLNTLAEDAAEGIAAFLEKREPEWTGR
jgi:enoyl-CoA hydratase/carnithine racemase